MPKELTPQNQHQADYLVLKNPDSTFDQIAKSLFNILEKVGNSEDCFWISHAWAESLIRGKTVPRSSYSNINNIDIRHDPEWQSDEPDYKGIHLSYGAESGLFTQFTKGIDSSLPERKYHHLEYMKSMTELHTFLSALENGRLVMVLINQSSKKEHALLVTKINRQLVIIDNSMEPGAWIKNWATFSDHFKNASSYVYTYPEKISK